MWSTKISGLEALHVEQSSSAVCLLNTSMYMYPPPPLKTSPPCLYEHFSCLSVNVWIRRIYSRGDFSFQKSRVLITVSSEYKIQEYKSTRSAEYWVQCPQSTRYSEYKILSVLSLQSTEYSVLRVKNTRVHDNSVCRVLRVQDIRVQEFSEYSEYRVLSTQSIQ